MKNPVCFALDFPRIGQAATFMLHHDLYDNVGAVKVGLELFMASGRDAVKHFIDMRIPVVLDLKLHDIPVTVEGAVKQGGEMGAKFMTLHIQQRETLERAMKAAEPFGIRLLGVTVLTSMNWVDGRDLEFKQPWPHDRTWKLGKFAYQCGLRGFVCSPEEVKFLKRDCPEAFFLVPGIRPTGSAADDQKRVGTPAQAIKDGADLLVIGRPIKNATDPRQAVRDILFEVQGAGRV
jgi:orotidine-5'-phosphate decarboxylase